MSKLNKYLLNPFTQKWDLIEKNLNLNLYDKGQGLEKDLKTEAILYWEKSTKIICKDMEVMAEWLSMQIN